MAAIQPESMQSPDRQATTAAPPIARRCGNLDDGTNPLKQPFTSPGKHTPEFTLSQGSRTFELILRPCCHRDKSSQSQAENGKALKKAVRTRLRPRCHQCWRGRNRSAATYSETGIARHRQPLENDTRRYEHSQSSIADPKAGKRGISGYKY